MSDGEFRAKISVQTDPQCSDEDGDDEEGRRRGVGAVVWFLILWSISHLFVCMVRSHSYLLIYYGRERFVDLLRGSDLFTDT